jgi:predicted branched-subunit amino acid permease
MRSPQRTSRFLLPALTLSSAVWVVGVAYGATASAAGFPDWLVILAAVLVLSASAELLFVGLVAAGALPLVAAVAALVVNLRNAVYGFSAGAFLPRGRILRALAAHVVNDESVAFATGQPDTPAKRRAFRAVGLAILVAWPLGAACGVLLGHVAPDPGRLGLDAAFPAIFLALLLGSTKRADAAGAAVGAGIALAVTPFVAVGLAPILGLSGLALGLRARVRRG